MKRSVKTISLEYGDARIKFYEIDLKTTSNNIPYLHSHCYYELHFLAGDTFVCSLKDREIKLKRNEFIIVPPRDSSPHKQRNLPPGKAICDLYVH